MPLTTLLDEEGAPSALSKEYDPDASGKRFSEMAPEERAREIERIFKLAREVIDREKAIESEAERVYVLGSTEAARF